MSVRRLAEDHVQPKAFAFNRSNGATVKGWIKKYPSGRQASAVIPLLMIAQEQEGWVTKAAIEHVAQMLEMPYIRVLEVATFYTQFMLQPVGTRAHVQVCGTTPCMLRGSEDLMRVCREKIHTEQFHTNADGTLSWEEVECQGACVNAPMVMIFKDAYEDLTPERLAEIIDEFEAGRGERVTTGPQVDRIFSAPEGGPLTLTSEIKAVGIRPSGTGAKKTKAPVPPTMAAKPKTDALETSRKIKSPDKAEGPGHVKHSKESATSRTSGMGPTMKIAETSARVQPKKPAPVKVNEGNPTMKVAATASGRSQKAGPVRLKKPEGKPDDLKMISGVGPKLEKTLNDLGFWHFSQIAKWTKKDIAIVDNELSFKGRIERDDWVRQAKALAKGGRDEYVKVFGREPR